ncbi:MAG: hypothetical protein WC536_00780 [Patescibacteria group bacterium]
MIIGIDIDDVLAESNLAFDKYHNKKYGTNFKKADHYTFDLGKIWNVTEDECTARLVDFFNSGHSLNIEPVTGAKEALLELAKDNELKVITARMEDFKDHTVEWLAKHYPSHLLEVHHANHYYGLNTNKKSDLCLKLGVEVLIDDCLEFAEECAEKGIKVLLLDSPWNQCDDLSDNIIRVKTWDEIVTCIKTLT